MKCLPNAASDLGYGSQNLQVCVFKDSAEMF